MKKLLLFTLLISQLSFANDSIEISILTCSAGQEVYSVFGHSAIRVIDKEKNIDQVYNFGMFDFNTPNFEYKYLKGKLKYYIGIQETQNFIKIYTHENRLVSEQILNLTSQQKRNLFSKLQFLYRPENRYYLYSFLDKNCSTEIRDLLNQVGIFFQNSELKESNRDLISSYLFEMPWLKLGINLVLGKSLDGNSTRKQSMFLPDYLQKEIGAFELNGEKLVKYKQTLNLLESKSTYNIQKTFSPILVFSILTLLFLFWFPIPIRIITSFSVGIIGLFILGLWLFSGHEEVKSNLNIIWCNPLYLLYIPLLIKNKTNRILSLTLMGTLSISVLIWIFNVQIFDVSILPMLTLLGILNFIEIKKTRTE
ncbi:Lnb N-terminal periplasmic domain-containing protein [Wenyingzhuangia aestuarii]|uniref:Lnb N-terminal periplasmic domain-containing protein n=1 Tax=Wenyingzhuangia aestuarii TaxID=1647582 RepID=UPI00143BD4A4|nr:DUF4105 domain-containing protein [Wenyingzhuangia aestuarii]NJB84146.1 hypothetical protein [Wenyingzhuangia aestuarii]